MTVGLQPHLAHLEGRQEPCLSANTTMYRRWLSQLRGRWDYPHLRDEDTEGQKSLRGFSKVTQQAMTQLGVEPRCVSSPQSLGRPSRAVWLSVTLSRVALRQQKTCIVLAV